MLIKSCSTSNITQSSTTNEQKDAPSPSHNSISKSLNEFIKKNAGDLENLFTLREWGNDELALAGDFLAEIPDEHLK
ncbi:hypothetical protein [Pantoea sp. App145]|uniref:hypothetical protein n=1 Tax=Pantoea sp. App145 TaxID=3071567 RepID=UPI003A7F8867